MPPAIVFTLLLTLLSSPTSGFVTQTSQSCRSWPLKGDFFDEISANEQELQGEEDEGRLSLQDLEATAPEWAKHVPKFSHVTLAGRVGNNPDPRYFDNGRVVLNLSLAVRRKYHPLERRALNIKEDETDWFNLELWGRDAEYATKFVTKGSRIGVSGSLVVDSWIDRETGDQRRKATVIVRDLDILESKAEAELRRGNQKQVQRRSFYMSEDEDDEFSGPFSSGTGGFFDDS